VQVISKSSLDMIRSSHENESMISQVNPADEESLVTSQPILSTKMPLRAEILSTQFQYLEPSDLPPPATYHVAFSSSSEWSDDSSSEDDGQDITGGRRHRQFPVRTLNSASPCDPMDLVDLIDNNRVSDLDETDTSSIDFLAHARKVDPGAVAAKERELKRGTSVQPEEKSLAIADSVDGASSPGPANGGSQDI
jgi:hypothetical protein